MDRSGVAATATMKGLCGEAWYNMPPKYGARIVASMHVVCDTAIHRPLEASGAMEPTTAPINDQNMYVAPIKKKGKIRAKKLLKMRSPMNDVQTSMTETETAPAFLHLSPSLPRITANIADPRKVTDPRKPMWNLLK